MAANIILYDANAIEVAVIGDVTLVIATCVAIIEILKSGSLIGGVTSVILIEVAILGAALEARRKDETNRQGKYRTTTS